MALMPPHPTWWDDKDLEYIDSLARQQKERIMRRQATDNKEYNDVALRGLIEGRLRKGSLFSVFAVALAHKHGDKVFLMLVTKDGQPVTLEDNWDLFPSDTLITQLRVLVG